VVYCNAGDDLDAVLRRVEGNGGRVLTGKTGDPENGHVAFFADTEGNRVGLHATA
jgi:predicted enzyme related to lactoylglutathione lyase